MLRRANRHIEVRIVDAGSRPFKCASTLSDSRTIQIAHIRHDFRKRWSHEGKTRLRASRNSSNSNSCSWKGFGPESARVLCIEVFIRCRDDEQTFGRRALFALQR